MTYEINVALLPLLMEKLNSFKKKFEKYGNGAVVFGLGEEYIDEKKNKPKSEWIGNVGERIEFTTTPVCVTSFDTEFGTTYIYKMMVGDDIIIWKTSKWLDDSAEVTIKATVKEHSEYRGDKQTVITRGKVSA